MNEPGRSIHEMQERSLGRQGTQRRLRIHRVTRLECLEGCRKLLEEPGRKFLDDDESLRRDARLPVVVHTAPHGPFNGALEIGILENDEGIAAAEFKRRRLEVLPGTGSNASTSRSATGEGDPLDPRVVDDPVRLIMRNQEIGVQAGWSTCLLPKRRKGDRALRNVGGVLHHQHVSCHQVRPGDPCQLVVREIPGLDTENHADGAAFHVRFANARMKLHRREEALRIGRVVGKNLGAEFDLSASFVDTLSHFQRHRAGQYLDLLMHEHGDAGDDDRPLRVTLVAPRLIAGRGGPNCLFQRLVRVFLEGPEGLAIERIDALIRHALFQVMPRRNARTT
jgi:hypothetical protein